MNELELSIIQNNEEKLIINLGEKLQEMVLYKNFILIGTELGNIFIVDISIVENPKYIKFSNKTNRIKQLKITNLDIDYLVVVSSDGIFIFYRVY